MARYAVVEVTIADVEPVASFIARAHVASALISGMTPAEAAALPGCVAAGIAEFLSALRDLGARQPAGDADDDGDLVP